MNVTQKLKFALRMAQNTVGNIMRKVEKCWLRAFSPFSTMFSMKVYCH